MCFNVPSNLVMCFNASPQGLTMRNQRALFLFTQKGPKTAPPGTFGSLWVYNSCTG